MSVTDVEVPTAGAPQTAAVPAPAAPSVTIPAEAFTVLLDKAFGRLESDIKADGPKAFSALKKVVSKVSSELKISWAEALGIVLGAAGVALHFLPKVVASLV